VDTVTAPPAPRRRDPGQAAAVVGVVVVSVYLLGALVWAVLHVGGSRTTVSDTVPIPLAVVAALSCLRARHRADASATARTAWLLIAHACASRAIGELIWFLLEVVGGVSPFPSAADAFHLAFYVLFFAGLLAMPAAAPRRRSDRTTFALDATTVLVATAMVVWYLVIDPTVHGANDTPLARALSLGHPAGDILLLFGVGWLLLRMPLRRNHAPLWLLALGAATLALADIVYARTTLNGTYLPGSLPDAAW
jgi:hypothetical protein